MSMDEDGFYDPDREEDALVDPAVDQFVSIKWREAMRASREAMESLREIWPELTQNMPETGANHLKSALDSFERANHFMHMSGKHVLGREQYDEYIEAQTALRLGKK